MADSLRPVAPRAVRLAAAPGGSVGPDHAAGGVAAGRACSVRPCFGRPCFGRADAGFTLAEMLVALGILLFGITALLGALGSSIGQRRTADARLELCALADRIVHEVQHTAIRPGPEGSSVDLVFTPLVNQPAAGFPGLTWSARATMDEERPDLWLVHIDVSWLEGGQAVEQTLLRVLPRQLPLRQRVVAFRNQAGDSTPR